MMLLRNDQQTPILSKPKPNQHKRRKLQHAVPCAGSPKCAKEKLGPSVQQLYFQGQLIFVERSVLLLCKKKKNEEEQINA